MLRVVIDTNLYVDWINHGRHAEEILGRDRLRYLSSVVVMELYAGARSTAERRRLQRLVAPFRAGGRLLVPAFSLYREAGEVLQGLRARFHHDLAGAYGLANDVLIALSARSIGATVVTQNAGDYRLIHGLRRFELRIVA